MKINVPILGNKKLDFYAESLSIVVLVYKPQGTGFTTWFDNHKILHTSSLSLFISTVW